MQQMIIKLNYKFVVQPELEFAGIVKLKTTIAYAAHTSTSNHARKQGLTNVTYCVTDLETWV